MSGERIREPTKGLKSTKGRRPKLVSKHPQPPRPQRMIDHKDLNPPVRTDVDISDNWGTDRRSLEKSYNPSMNTAHAPLTPVPPTPCTSLDYSFVTIWNLMWRWVDGGRRAHDALNRVNKLNRFDSTSCHVHAAYTTEPCLGGWGAPTIDTRCKRDGCHCTQSLA